MPYHDPDETDPMTLHGVAFDVDDTASHREMAACFIEEYIRLGFDRQRLIGMFQAGGYSGPQLAWAQLGPAEIVGMIDSLLSRWGPRAPSGQCLERSAAGRVSLPVLG